MGADANKFLPGAPLGSASRPFRAGGRHRPPSRPQAPVAPSSHAHAQAARRPSQAGCRLFPRRSPHRCPSVGGRAGHSGHGESAAVRAPHPYVVERRGARASGARRPLRPQRLRCSLRHRPHHSLGRSLARAPVVRPRGGLCLVPRGDRGRGRARPGALRPAGAPGGRADAQHLDPDLAAHAVAVGLREFVSPDVGLVGSLLAAREAGAALVGAHPHGPDRDPVPARTTRRFWREWQSLSPLLHRAELFNGADVYSWVAGCGVPAIASGDTHRREQVSSWKTLLPCAKDEEEIVAFLRSPRSAYLVPFRAETAVEPAAAA